MKVYETNSGLGYMQKAYLIKAENSYFELCDLYNFRKIECTQKEQMRSIEEINNEILKIVKENNGGTILALAGNNKVFSKGSKIFSIIN